MHLKGTVLPDGGLRDIFVSDEGRISFDPISGAQTVLESGYLTPGLVDCHCHLALASPSRSSSEEEQVQASARAELDAGVLALRETGSSNRLSTRIGPLIGLPRTVTAGRFLAPPDRYFPHLSLPVTEEDLLEVALNEVKASGLWCKVVGDFEGPSGSWEAFYKRDTLMRVAAGVHAAGGKMAIHATLPDVIEAAIDAGVDSLEHGFSMEPSFLPKMVTNNVTWVPTMIICEGVLEMIADGPQPFVDAMAETLERFPAMVKAGAEAGVRILAGTDAGLVPHGLIAEEISLLRQAGLTPDQALGAGSWDARAFLGLPGISAGAPADLVAYAMDPRSDPEALRHPLLRILDGRLLS